jgi:hypothetical protein
MRRRNAVVFGLVLVAAVAGASAADAPLPKSVVYMGATLTIEPGKIANMVILDKNPVEDIANVRSVYMVVKRGIPYLRSSYKPASAEDFK